LVPGGADADHHQQAHLVGLQANLEMEAPSVMNADSLRFQSWSNWLSVGLAYPTYLDFSSGSASPAVCG
jgi:hypothetical protein